MDHGDTWLPWMMWGSGSLLRVEGIRTTAPRAKFLSHVIYRSRGEHAGRVIGRLSGNTRLLLD
jgi:hypothetical protein